MKIQLSIEIDNDHLREHIADRRYGQSKEDAYIDITDNCVLNGLSCIDAMIARVSGGHSPLAVGTILPLSDEDEAFVSQLLAEDKNK
jgi:hypothetical protein